MVLVPVLVFAGLLGLLAFLSTFAGGHKGAPEPRGSAAPRKKKGSKKQQQRNKKQKQTGAEQAAARSGDAKLPGATPAEAEPEAAAAALSAAAVEPASSSATEEEEEIDGGSFLGIDDVLPSHKGVYVVEGQVDSSTREESLWDGWETVDPVKYNIPRGNKLTAQGVPATSGASAASNVPSRPRSGAGGSAGPAKSKNEKRREKQNMVRALQQTRPVGSSVAERMGSKGGRRQQQEPAARASAAAHVPGM
mmetsp:Transcript_30915/g.79404  ORF Transcript_30915/g.79404 Transcript_30915/m.79404 type:complete len:250 (+) Transcript_30915:420-1169(+)